MTGLKNFLILTMILLATPVYASDISYTIINGTSTNKVMITVSSVIKRIQHDCDLITYNCIVTKEQEIPRIENPLRQVSTEILDERDRNSTSTPKASVFNEPQKIDYGIFNVPIGAYSVVLSPDGNKLAYFLGNRELIKTSRSFVLLFNDGKKLEKFDLTDRWELITDAPKLFAFTDDSKKLVYLDDRAGFPQLYLVDLEKKQHNLLGVPLITKPYTTIDFVIKENTVYFIANRNSPYNWGLYSIELSTRKFSVIDKDIMYTNDLIIVGDDIIFTENQNGTGVLKSYNTKLNIVNNFTGIKQEKAEVNDYKIISNKDLKGVLIKPQKEKNTSKAVIWLHGGPYRQLSPQRHPWGSYATYDWILDELVSSGVTVLKIDYPGSMGYGTNYALSLVNKVGDVDVISLSKAISYLNSIGIKEIYLFGNSYGGYLSAKGLVELDSKLSGAFAVAPVTDWQKLIEETTPTSFEVHFGGIPNDKNQYMYDKSSIVKSLSKLTKPLVLFHGDLDKQIPFSQSEYLLREATALNKNVVYYSINGQTHIINGVAQNEAICNKIASVMKLASSTDLCVMN